MRKLKAIRKIKISIRLSIFCNKFLIPISVMTIAQLLRRSTLRPIVLRDVRRLLNGAIPSKIMIRVSNTKEFMIGVIKTGKSNSKKATSKRIKEHGLKHR